MLKFWLIIKRFYNAIERLKQDVKHLYLNEESV